MSIHEALKKIKYCTCAIGYLEKPVNEINQNSEPPKFKILGSGFLIGAGAILTNRHVVLEIKTATQKYRLSEDRRVIQFTNEEAQIFLPIRGEGYMADEFDKTRSDVGFLSFATDSGFNPVAADVEEELDVSVGDAIGVYGYAYGEQLHHREAKEKIKIYRFGPVLQQGFISGMAPFDAANYVERFLLDVRTAKGMSGAPVFKSTTGAVIGIHSTGIGADVAFAIPIDRKFVSKILDIVNGPSVSSGKIEHHFSPRQPMDD
jgi:hypothetical protein